MQHKKERNYWISIADMMAGIMMIFLLIMVSFMLLSSESKSHLVEQNRRYSEINTKMSAIAKDHSDLQVELYNELQKEFAKDFSRWNAQIDTDNTIRFRDPEVLFDTGDKQVKKRFQNILDDFFPRYVTILSLPKYKESIEEIRIEGHTSSNWESATTLEDRYLGNAELSQARAFEVLKYCFNQKSIDSQKYWLIAVLRANGLSFARPLQNDAISRRVEFRVLTKADKNLTKILELSKEFAH
ncbi:MAG: OmpA family protein [Helicobacter sp.]|nr:OmpA family protein [Helicobacter sp.]MDY5740406.1 OmpA family protein [Helicobacter sp.]